MTKKVQWGILGTSFISHVMAEAIQASATSELVAIASRNITKAETFAADYSIKAAYDNYQSLLSDPAVDAVYIGLPNEQHKEWSIKAAHAGKHILCEKPFALTVAEMEEAKQATESAGVFCLEALMYRYHPLTKKLQSLMQEKMIGEPRFYHGFYSANIAHIANPTAGGAIRNLGCYPASLILLLAGASPTQCLATGRTNTQGRHDHLSSCLLTFPDGSHASITTADDLEMEWLFEIYGSTGHLKVSTNPWLPDQTTNTIVIKNDTTKQTETINITADKPLYTYQVDEMNRLILNKEDPIDQSQTWLEIKRQLQLQEKWLAQIVG